jgi:putative effector of murein hydrolase LrgA (UPF0299 family)
MRTSESDTAFDEGVGQVATRQDAARDDRILPLARWASILIPPFLITAFVLLFFFPNDTERLWAWTVRPALTPMIMGAGYISGSYFFTRVFLGGHWHWYSAGFLPVAAFTWFMLLSSLLHFDRFNKEHVSFYAWMLLYIVTPFLIPALWFLNRKADPGTPDPDDVVVPQPVRLLMGALGALQVGIAILMFIFPAFFISVWPWMLTPLTDRVMAGWFALAGVLMLMVSLDSRWSAQRIPLQAQIIGLALILVALVRGLGDVDATRATTWLFVGGMSFLFLFVLAVIVLMEARRGGKRQLQ